MKVSEHQLITLISVLKEALDGKLVTALKDNKVRG